MCGSLRFHLEEAMSVKETIDGRGRRRYRVYVHNSTIKKSVYIGTFDRPKDAQEAEFEAKRRLRLGESLKPAPAREEISFDTLSKRWHKGLVSVRPSTKTDYDKALRRIKPYLGSRLVSAITRRDVDEMISGLSDRYAPSTVRKTVVVFKMVMRMAVDHDHTDKMPTGGSRLALPRMRKRTFEPLTAEQVKLLIESVQPEYWQPFVRLLLTSGLRRAEAWGLRVQDLDLEKGVAHVRGQLVGKQLVELKTDAAYRDVPLPRTTIEALESHLASLPGSELNLLFPSREGKPVDPCHWYARVWIPAREKAGLPYFRLHDCRHHVASVYLSQGRSITYVQRLLGHSNPSTLLSIYSWVTRGEADIATSEFEQWLGEEECALYGWILVAA